MSATRNDSRIGERVDSRQRVRSASKLLLAIASVTVLLYLGSLLPGIDRVVPATELSLATIVRAIATVAVVSLLVHLASDLAALTRLLGDAPRLIVENVSSVVYWLGILAAVIVAHWGLAPAATTLIPAWAYDVGFLVLSLPPLAFVAARLYYTLDPAADLVTERVVGEPATDGERTQADDSSGQTDSSGRPDVIGERDD